MDEIQQPMMTPNPVNSQPIAPQPEQKEATTPYVVEGLVVGVVIALVIIGGMYFKAKLSSKIQLQNQTAQQVAEKKKQQDLAQQASQQSEKVTPTPSPAPTVTPVSITTKQDLTTQQTALDNSDMTDITKGLEENEADSSQFAL